MSDNIKLIIEIPKEAKEYFDKLVSDDFKYSYYDHNGIIGKVIRNGIPLDNIKTEIEAEIDPLDDSQENIAMIRAFNKVIDVFDKYIGETEYNEGLICTDYQTRRNIESIPSADIMECARTIKEYCENRLLKLGANCCDSCPFKSNILAFACAISHELPSEWDLPEGEKGGE